MLTPYKKPDVLSRSPSAPPAASDLGSQPAADPAASSSPSASVAEAAVGGPEHLALDFPFIFTETIESCVVSQISGSAIVTTPPGRSINAGEWCIAALHLDGLDVSTQQAADDVVDPETLERRRVAMPRHHIMHATLVGWLLNEYRHAIADQWADLLASGETPAAQEPAKPAAAPARKRKGSR